MKANVLDRKGRNNKLSNLQYNYQNEFEGENKTKTMASGQTKQF
jgi:hypothetical protein